MPMYNFAVSAAIVAESLEEAESELQGLLDSITEGSVFGFSIQHGEEA